MSDLSSRTNQPHVIPSERVHLAFEASFEITSLSRVMQRLIDEAELDDLGKACCGILIRIQQLSEAIGACVDEEPARNYRLSDQALREVVLGANHAHIGHG